MKKYEITDDCKTFSGKKLFRIKALIDFGEVKKGEKGGYIESEKNLDHSGNAWVAGNACVYENAFVTGDALVSGNANVFGRAIVSGSACVSYFARVTSCAKITDNAIVAGYAIVAGRAKVSGRAKLNADACVYEKKDYITINIFGENITFFCDEHGFARASYRHFYGTIPEFIEYVSSTKDGKEYYELMKIADFMQLHF